MENKQKHDLFNLPFITEAGLAIELGWVFRNSRVLLAAYQAGFFEALRQPKSAGELAAECSTDAEVSEKVLIAMCALGVLKRTGSLFDLTPLGREILLPESLRYIGGALDFSEYMWWEWSVLPDMLKGGEKYARRFRQIKELQRDAEYIIKTDYFPLAMHTKAINGGVQFVAAHVDLSKRRLLLDIGGGPGTYSAGLCQRFPNLKAIVWDAPGPLAVARQVIRNLGLEDRIRLETGDWETDEFSPGCDVILLSNVMHGPDSGAAEKLAKVFRALDPGGVIIVQEFLLDADKNGPLEAAVFNIMVGAFSDIELIGLIGTAGFREVALVARNPLTGSGLITAVKPG
ncbi:methyltransferase [Dehalogenimonas alkenigignens]|uniref:O-methyltransferase n=1 Tax=Dehalogenimonas alkenigignens TaxID=1217799 RepID=A0A0W0GIA7_9CHLR|nr:methyltransferase [Dehalogenimonas alkenigignens]KTB48277.1 O-methyltransferase [Dehalogenimonas alkenigignens]PVV84509.1 methyltransferase domain-containing protein [Dehalogenimonas alkenigignens]